MQQSTARKQGRLSHVLRAAAIEVASSRPEVPAQVEVTAPVPVDSQGEQALHELVATFGRQVDELRLRRGQAIGEIAGLSVELGIALAERLLCAEIAADRQRLERIVRHALERFPPELVVIVKGHPHDIALLEQQLMDPELQPVREVLQLRPDSALARGQVKLETDQWFVAWDTASALTELGAALIAETSRDE